jgi:hypothetical protein
MVVRINRGDGVKATVVFCAPGIEHVIEVEVPAGTTLEQAISGSGLIERVRSLRGVVLDLGVWNRSAPAEQPVREGDRIEVYRPLAIDPKEARRLRAAARRRQRQV